MAYARVDGLVVHHIVLIRGLEMRIGYLVSLINVMQRFGVSNKDKSNRHLRAGFIDLDETLVNFDAKCLDDVQ